MKNQVLRKTLSGFVGQELGVSDWLEIDQSRINQFADVTCDHQAIHVDQEAAAATPFGTTIAHGFLLLSLGPQWLYEQVPIPEGVGACINYGLDKVRFLTPVKSGARVRMRSRLLEVQEKGAGRYLLKVEMTLEVEDENTPAMIAEMLMLAVPS